jgi:hypothetical protein
MAHAGKGRENGNGSGRGTGEEPSKATKVDILKLGPQSFQQALALSVGLGQAMPYNPDVLKYLQSVDFQPWYEPGMWPNLEFEPETPGLRQQLKEYAQLIENPEAPVKEGWGFGPQEKKILDLPTGQTAYMIGAGGIAARRNGKPRTCSGRSGRSACTAWRR